MSRPPEPQSPIPDPQRSATVLSGTGGVWQLRTDSGDVISASLRGRLKTLDRPSDADRSQSPGGSAPLKLAVGDRVTVEQGERGEWAIAAIHPRRSKLARRAPGKAYGERIIAANIDQVVIVFAAAKPDPHRRMLDRFLVIAEANDLTSRIVINKVDLVDPAESRRMFADYERAGYPVHYTSVKRAEGTEELRAALAESVSVLTGPSGVGKSSMLNTLFPGLDLRVGEISQSVNKGRHTTVGAVMVPLPGVANGYVIDTPGLREVGMSELPARDLDRCFPEMRTLVDECRFRDCRHVSEPDCAVRAAVAAGRVSAERHSSYLSLLEELA